MAPVTTVPTGMAFHEGPAGPSVPGLVTTVKAPGLKKGQCVWGERSPSMVTATSQWTADLDGRLLAAARACRQ
jgi:hypothetical protein